MQQPYACTLPCHPYKLAAIIHGAFSKWPNGPRNGKAGRYNVLGISRNCREQSLITSRNCSFPSSSSTPRRTFPREDRPIARIARIVPALFILSFTRVKIDSSNDRRAEFPSRPRYCRTFHNARRSRSFAATSEIEHSSTVSRGCVIDYARDGIVRERAGFFTRDQIEIGIKMRLEITWNKFKIRHRDSRTLLRLSFTREIETISRQRSGLRLF